MKVEDIKQTVVVGAGMMGVQIAQRLSQVGKYRVTVTDIKDEFINKGLQFMTDGLKKHFVDKGKMTQHEMDEIVGRIRGTTDLAEAAKNADFAIEAVFENLDVKKNIFKQLDTYAPAKAIFASNTSNLNISEMASVTQRPDKVIGMHFFNPVAVMKLVEVVRGPLTSDETVDTIVALARKLDKEPVVCKDFSFGFLANRAYGPMFEEAVQMVWERVAPPEDIDKALKLGYNLPMGPLELGDYIGMWHIWIEAEEAAMKERGPEKGHVHPLVRMMVRAGYTGGMGRKGIYAFYRDVLSKW